MRRGSFDPVEVEAVALKGDYGEAEAALEWTLAWPNYGETVDALPAALGAAVRSEALLALRRLADLSWHLAINYYTAAKPL